MFPITRLSSFEQLRILSDPRRLRILRILMAGQASLTIIGRELGEHPAWVRHHLNQLEAAGLVELAETRTRSGVVEKFYRACASGLLLQQLVLPEDPSRQVIVFSGSHDLAVEYLAEKLSTHVYLLTLPVGSLDGLIALRQNFAQVTGCHLLDPGGEYNLPFINHFFPDRSMQVVTLANREQGMITAAGNPKRIHSLNDLAREDVLFINRNPGSGTRLWFDQQLSLLDIKPSLIKGYSSSVFTHTECARLVHEGRADAAIGLHAAAHRFGLDFTPLFSERYDLVFSKEDVLKVHPLLDTLQTAACRQTIAGMAGYETQHTGEQVLH